MQNLLSFLKSERETELPPREPARRLTFSPLAWLKLQLFLHAGDTEVGGFGISSDDDPLYVADFATVTQSCTAVTVRFDDAAVADYFDAKVDEGLEPCRFARLWVHTHPGDSPFPSRTDEETFARVFGSCDWAVMFILSRTGRTYARLSFEAGPGGSELLGVDVDWASWPTLLIEEIEQLTGRLCGWIAEYAANIRPAPPTMRIAVTEPGLVMGNGWPGGEEDGLDRLHTDQWAEQQASGVFEGAQDDAMEVGP